MELEVKQELSRQIQLKLPWELFERAAELDPAEEAGVNHAETEGGIQTGWGACGRQGAKAHLMATTESFLFFLLGNSSEA